VRRGLLRLSRDQLIQLGAPVKLQNALGLMVTALAVSVACRSPEVQPESTAAASASAAPVAAPAASAQTRVTQIAFLDKQECCQCTQTRIDATWSALQSALAGRQKAPAITRVHVDTQTELAAQYRSKQAFVALPAVYLLDGEGNVVELLQGEVTQAELSAALEK